MELVKCDTCGKQMHPRSCYCPHCGIKQCYKCLADKPNQTPDTCKEVDFQPEHQTVEQFLGAE